MYAKIDSYGLFPSKQKSLIIISCIFLLQSCFPSFGTKYLIKRSKVAINSSNVIGIYKNISSINTETSLWKTLQLNSKKLNDTTDLNTDLIQLELKNPKTLEVSLVRNRKTIKKIHLAGKIKKKSFSLKRHRELIPFYPIYYKEYELKSILSKSKNELILVRGMSNSGAILILGAGYENIQTYTFDEIKDY